MKLERDKHMSALLPRPGSVLKETRREEGSIHIYSYVRKNQTEANIAHLHPKSIGILSIRRCPRDRFQYLNADFLTHSLLKTSILVHGTMERQLEGGFLVSVPAGIPKPLPVKAAVLLKPRGTC